MTIQEYKEKIIHTIEQMEMEHKISVEKFEIEAVEVYNVNCCDIAKKRNLKMIVR